MSNFLGNLEWYFAVYSNEKRKKITSYGKHTASGCSPWAKGIEKQAAESPLCSCCQRSVWIKGLWGTMVELIETVPKDPLPPSLWLDLKHRWLRSEGRQKPRPSCLFGNNLSRWSSLITSPISWLTCLRKEWLQSKQGNSVDYERQIKVDHDTEKFGYHAGDRSLQSWHWSPHTAQRPHPKKYSVLILSATDNWGAVWSCCDLPSWRMMPLWSIHIESRTSRTNWVSGFMF